MFGGRKTVKGDDSSQLLQKQGAYSMKKGKSHPYEMDHEDLQEKKIYSFRGGVKYTFIFTFILFWLPPFGQMIAGYIGGRKSGSAFKGTLATLVPVAFIFFLFWLSRAAFMAQRLDWLFELPETGATAAAGMPLLGQMAEFATDYIRTFIRSFGFGDTWVTPYILTVIFGYLGGLMSARHQKELEVEHRLENMPTKIGRPDPDIPVVMGKKPDGWED